MRKLSAFVLCVLIFAACHKSASLQQDDSMTPQNSTLNGEWTYHSNRISPGYPVTDWTLMPVDTFKIKFSANGVFSSNIPTFHYTHYEVISTTEVVLSSPPASSLFTIKYKFEGPYLRLNLPCYEECSHRFIR
jgi:hypothetical protein